MSRILHRRRRGTGMGVKAQQYAEVLVRLFWKARPASARLAAPFAETNTNTCTRSSHRRTPNFTRQDSKTPLGGLRTSRRVFESFTILQAAGHRLRPVRRYSITVAHRSSTQLAHTVPLSNEYITRPHPRHSQPATR